MKSSVVCIASLLFFQKTLGQIGKGETLEGEDLILTCSVGSLIRVCNDSFAMMKSLILSKRKAHGSDFTVLAVYDVKQNKKYLWNGTNLTGQLALSRNCVINKNYTPGLQITLKSATSDDTGLYLCGGYFIVRGKIKNVNITQQVITKAKQLPLQGTKPEYETTSWRSAISGLVVSAFVAVGFSVTAWCLLKKKCKKGKELLAYLRFKWKVSPVVRYFQRLCRKIDRKKKAAERTVEYTEKYCEKTTTTKV